MKELKEEIEALQWRLKNCGGGKITITSEGFDIRLGKEHEEDNEQVALKRQSHRHDNR